MKMKATLYPTLAETLELHSRLIERFGGKDGVRNNGESFLIQEVIKKKASIEVIATWLEKHMKAVV